MADTFTVRLRDETFGRVVLVPEVASTAAQAETAALASPGISGPTSKLVQDQVIDQEAVASVTGTDADGNPTYSVPNVALPPPSFPPTVPDPHSRG